MRKHVLGWLCLLCVLTGCSVTTQRSIQSDTTLFTPKDLPLAGRHCLSGDIVWQGRLADDRSLLTLCTAPNGYRLVRQYPDKTITEVEALASDVGLEKQSSRGGFWLRTDSLYYSVMEGNGTAIFEIDQDVPLRGWLPRFVSGVVTDNLHFNNTRDYLH